MVGRAARDVISSSALSSDSESEFESESGSDSEASLLLSSCAFFPFFPFSSSFPSSSSSSIMGLSFCSAARPVRLRAPLSCDVGGID